MNDIYGIDKVLKAENIFQHIAQVTSEYTKHFSLRGKLNVHKNRVKPCILDYVIIQLILEEEFFTLISNKIYTYCSAMANIFCINCH